METKYSINYNSQMIFCAIHNGHHISEHVREKIGITDLERKREEDPFTEQFINDKDNHIIQYTSRFEVDLNRHIEKAVYQTPSNCWGLPIYPTTSLTDIEIQMALEQHNLFYQNMIDIIEKHLEKYDKLIVWDIHSYNHRRNGEFADFDPEENNPEIIIGTNNYKYMSPDWEPLVNNIEQMFKSHKFTGDFPNRPSKQEYLDVRQNVKFPGGYLSQFINQRYPDRACCLAIEFKKIWMNEWSQEVDEDCFTLLKKIFNDVCLTIEI